MEFNRQWYEEKKAQGCDLSFFGDWQKSYAKMVLFVTGMHQIAANHQNTSIMVDIGTACGVNFKAFKEIGMFKEYYGTDISKDLIEIGKKVHKFSDKELFYNDITENSLPFKDEEVLFIHCSQVLEHISENKIDKALEEMQRILHPEGRIFLSIASVHGTDSTYISIFSEKWWRTKLKKYFNLNGKQKSLFRVAKFSPDNTTRTFYDYYNSSWTIFILNK